jgi:glycosyltransferase involved in cell wall biosynthesis
VFLSSKGQSIRVIFNDRVLFRTMTGVGKYARQLLRAFEQQRSEFVVEPYLSRRFGKRDSSTESDRSSPNAKQPASKTKQSGRAVALARPMIQGALALLFRWDSGGFDLYHEPNQVPLRSKLPTVTTVHDLSVLEHPEWHPRDRVRWYERDFTRGAERTTRFITDSRYTQSRMQALLGIAPEKIDVVYLGPGDVYHPQAPETISRVLSKLSLPERFFLFVGTLEPRKNVKGLIEAFDSLPEKTRQAVPLVLIGGAGWQFDHLGVDLDALQSRSDVRWLGYLGDDRDLAALYSAATALVWPSWYEGFGLPPLEAMACGCPVIVSNTTSLPEVIGAVGISLAPDDTAAWTASMQRAAEDESWRAAAQESGIQQAASFSWQRCAAETLSSYARALEAARG